MKKLEKNIKKFSGDTKINGGYLYTTNEVLSSSMANKHITDIVLSMVKLKNKTIIDIGCGDGVYTQDWFKHGKPKKILALDPAKHAVEAAIRNNRYQKNVKYEIGDIYHLPKKHFDIAIVRGVLHHLYKPEIAMIEISKIADRVIVVEPNGYNPILKVIERLSPYHLSHEEKSYPPYLIDRWIIENGGKICKRAYGGLVPFFCNDLLARVLKAIEPYFEQVPLLKQLVCANYYVVYENKKLRS